MWGRVGLEQNGEESPTVTPVVMEFFCPMVACPRPTNSYSVLQIRLLTSDCAVERTLKRTALAPSYTCP